MKTKIYRIESFLKWMLKPCALNCNLFNYNIKLKVIIFYFADS